MSISYYQLILGVLTAISIAYILTRVTEKLVHAYYDWQDKRIFLEWEEDKEELDNE